MSNSERRARRELSAQEIMKQVQETGQSLHKSIGYGLTDKQKLERIDKLSWEYLQEIPELKLKCEPKSQELEALASLEEAFSRVIQAVQAIARMPKQSPKKRDLVQEQYFEAQARLLAVRDSLEAQRPEL
jgi:hypothetical protein